MQNYAILELMKKRASVRTFSAQPINENDLAVILEAARFAPSGGNEQPYRFVVVRDKVRLSRIAEIAGQSWIRSAAAVVVLCCKICPDSRGGRDIQKKRFPHLVNEIGEIPQNVYAAVTIEEHQTKIPGTVMMLQALELGLCTTWISLFNVEDLAHFLQLPCDIVPSEMLALGYSKNETKLLPKKAIDELVFYESYPVHTSQGDQ